MTKNKHTTKQGFTLIISIFLASIVLTITLSMMQLLYKQLVLSTADRESQIAFFAADTGMECAYYWDFRGDISGSSTGSIFSSTNSATIAGIAPMCGSENIYTNPGPGGEVAFENNFASGSSIDDITTFYMTNIASTTACNYVIIKKNRSTATTSIESHGQNRCTVGDLRRVERAIQFRY